MFRQRQDSGVSPVIGIILMVAVTVGLVALASTIVFDLGSNVNEPADASVNLQYDENDNELRAELVRNENADRVFLRAPLRNDGDSADDDFTTGSPQSEITGELDLTNSEGGTGTEVVDVTSKNVINTPTGGSDTTQPIQNRQAEVVAVIDGNEQVIATEEYSDGASAP
jgi:flagellin-like protein